MRRFLIVVLALLSGCGGRSSGGPATPAETQDAAPSVKTLRIAEGSAEEGAVIDLAYPGLVLPGKAEAEGKVNAEVKRVVDIFVREFREASAEPVAVEPGTFSMLEGDFETTLLDERTAAFRLTVSQFIAGAAHPGSTARTLNFDLATGELLELGDIFQPQSGYLQVLSDHCRKVVEAVWLKEGPLDATATEWINAGTRPVEENFAEWSLSRDGLEIVFNEYQVGPYAMGAVRCDVPRETLASILKTAGPLPGGPSTIAAPAVSPTPSRTPSPTPKLTEAAPAPAPPPPLPAPPAAPAPPASGSTRTLGYPFAIQVGETVAIDGEAATITYERLLEDSRCPADVQCIWAGNARILVTAAKAGQPPAGIEINTTLEPRAGSYSGYTVTLVDLGTGGQPAATLTVGRG